MIPRKRIDIEWTDILRGTLRCFLPGRRLSTQGKIEESWSSLADTVVCLSVRSGFDLLLESLRLPPGSEVLVSAMNIRSMFDVIRKHQLVAVPIDLDMATLSMKPDELERAVTAKTKVVLAAQLFGSRRPLDDVVEFARRNGLFVIEDCAQAFTGDGYLGHPGSDVVMVSFGPIKTCSTIMGGILRITDGALCAKVKRLQASLPVHSRWDFLKWLANFALLKIAGTRFIYSLIIGHVLQRNDQSKINDAVRIFGGADEFVQFRKQPSYPMLALLKSRLARFEPARIERRRAAAEMVIERLPFVRRPGERIAYHTHWIFPVEVTSPVEMMEHLRARGFDSTVGYSSFIIPDPPEEHSEFRATEARRMMENVLYLPVHAGVSEAELVRLADLVTEFELADQERKHASSEQRSLPRDHSQVDEAKKRIAP